MQNIDYKVLNEYKKDIEEEYKNFKMKVCPSYKENNISNSTYEFFDYIMLKLEFLINDIDYSYKNIVDYFEEYLKNVYSLESYLSSEGRLGSISQMELRNYVDYKFPSLK